MCGIVGVAGAIGIKEENVFKDMLIFDAVRGINSTGVAGVTSMGGISVTKLAAGPTDLVQYGPFNKMLAKVNNVLIGHNRYATQGAVNSVNAHPFEFETVVGVHNGTLRNQYKLPDSREYDVDSENIFHAIDTMGIEETVPLLDGAYALVWWDAVEENLNFLRNKERPLCYAFDTDGKNLYWASEAGFLRLAAARRGVKLGEVTEFTVDTHYSIEIKRGQKLPEFSTELRLGFTPPLAVTSTTTGGKWGPNTWNPKTGKWEKKDNIPVIGTKGVIYSQNVWKKYGKRSYNTVAFEARFTECSMCGVIPDFGPKHTIIECDTGTEELVCEDCSHASPFVN